MKPIFIFLIEKTPETIPYKTGYAIGYFVGGHLFEILVAFLVIVSAIIYFAFFRKNRKKINSEI